MLLDWAFDATVAFTLLALAWAVLGSRDLFKAVVLFIVFGLLMALAWVRLGAVDVALAEAAIGAGITGALLLAALARLQHATKSQVGSASEATVLTPPLHPGNRVLLLTGLAGLAGILGYVVVTLPPAPSSLIPLIEEHLGASGVVNPVTAVLLNFRGYDTLLELGVLLIAVTAVMALGLRAGGPEENKSDAVLSLLAGILIPTMMLVSGYLLWVGAYAPGGAFQGGSVLAAALVLMLLAGRKLPSALSGWTLRATAALGFGAFCLVGAGTMIAGGRLLEYPVTLAGGLILVIETAAMLSIGVILAIMFQSGSITEARE